MAAVHLAEQARDELRHIFRAIAADNREAARRVVGRILDRCRTLAGHPLLGRERPEFGLPALRSTAIAPHVVFYRVTEGGVVEVVHIIDGRRDLEALLNPPTREDLA